MNEQPEQPSHPPVQGGGGPAESGQPAPGWYPDPSGQATDRWWDGSQWTDWTNQNLPDPGSTGSSGPSRWVMVMLVIFAIPGVAVVLLLGYCFIAIGLS